MLADALDLSLKKAGFTTTVVYNGQQALNILKTEHFDMVLLDLIMPIVDGWQVLKKLAEPKIRTVVISNLVGTENIEKARKMGAEEYIVKADTSLEDLVKNIVALLEQKFAN